jgi:hypothetical protein
MNILLPGVEKRLQARYQELVQEHSGSACPVASGPRLLPSPNSCQAAAMAAWRFYHNPRITFSRLAQPLLQAAADAASSHCRDFALVPIDWSWLNYGHHASKTDRLRGPYGVVGYQLLSALLVSDRDGQPLAPLAAQLQTAQGLLSSRFDRPRKPRSPLDELAVLMDFVKGQPLGKRPVFIIDAEGDSVHHYRQWHKRGLLFLVRGDSQRVVRLGNQDGPALSQRALALRLRRAGAFEPVRMVDYQGRQVRQEVAQAEVVLDREGWLNRVVDGRRQRIRRYGVALPLRLVITELRDERGRLLERWYLLSNVPQEVTAVTLALWYYWRWIIETFFKLLKSAGQQVEHWQQENGTALLKRLLVASMACVLAWRLGHSQAPQADEARRVVMSLSGRQMEHGKSYTLEGLLAGMWVLVAMRALWEQMPINQLQGIADFVLNGSVEANSQAPAPLREAG